MRVAAIDVGTNSIHLLVADVSPSGEITTVEKNRAQVQLGSGGLSSRRITDDAFQRGVDALVSFREICDHFDVVDVNAAATSAVREAENGAAFTRTVRDRTGIHVRTISGTDEARLIYLGARNVLDFTSGRVLIIDLGGGSTELILCDTEDAHVLMSLPLGHIRLSEAFHTDDPLSPENYKAMKKEINTRLKPVKARLHPDDIGTVVGTSGAIRTLARMSTLARGDRPPEHSDGLVLMKSDLDEFVHTFRELPKDRFGELPGMDLRRRDTLPAGAILVRKLLKAVKKTELRTSEKSLRDGLVVDWILRHAPEVDLARTVADPRRRTVLAVMKRYDVDEVHSRLVARMALSLFDGLAPLHGLRIDDRRMLEFAALLHDVGHAIAGQDHNKHGAYILRHTRMSGFTAPEIAILSNLVRYHRGSKPKTKHAGYGALSSSDRRRVKVLAGILRLADALDRSHNQPVDSVNVDLKKDKILIRAWSSTAADLEHWAAHRRRRLLQKVLGRPVEIEIVVRDKVD